MRPRVTTVITDLDNTLYDWVAMWGTAFAAMMGVLVERSGVPRHVLEAESRLVHQEHRSTEYAFLVQALPCLRRRHPGEDLAELYGDAIEASRAARDASLRLFPSVRETLVALKATGCLLVGYTDSRASYSGYRVRKLGLDGLLDFLYSPPDHALPAGDGRRGRPPEPCALRSTVHRLLPEGEVKPNPKVLADIVESVGASPERTLYVGDSLLKDVAMAQEVGLADVFARYGVLQHRDHYDLLRRVSHWTDAEIQRERAMRALQSIRASYTLSGTFSELLDLFQFEAFVARPAA